MKNGTMTHRLFKMLLLCLALACCFLGVSTLKTAKTAAATNADLNLVKVEVGQNSLSADAYQTADLLSAQAGGEKSIKLDYTIKLNADEAKNAHNADPENAGIVMGEEQEDKTSSSVRYLDFDFRLEVRGQYYTEEYNEWHSDMQLLWITTSTTYSYYDRSYYDNKGNYWEVPDFNQWYQTKPQYDFIKFSSNGKNAQFSINATIADLEKVISENNPEYSNIQILEVSVDAVSSYSSTKSFDSGYLDSKYITIIDVHSREADIPDRVWRLTLDKQLEILNGAPHRPNEEKYTLTDSDYLAPTSIKYAYHANFQNRGQYRYQDQNGDWQNEEYGFTSDDFQGNFYSEINPHNGKTYGFWEGELPKTVSTLKLREFVNAQNRALIMSMIGLKPSGAGGTAMIMLGCDVEFTFADGKKLVVPVRFGHEMTHLVAPCIHACSNCGECTAEEMLECNSEMYYGGADGIRVSECKCDKSNSITITPVFNGTTDVDGTSYSVDINQLSVPDNSEGTYVEALQNITPSLDIQAIYQVDVTNNYNEPFDGQYSNQVATVTFTVNNEIGQGLQNGNLGVVHINTETGEGERFEKEDADNQGAHGTFSVKNDGGEYSVTITSNSYSPILIVNLSHTHSYGEGWQKDSAHHWHECDCGQVEYRYPHAYDNDQDATCNECGYERTVNNPSTSNKDKGLSGGAIVGIAVGGAALAGVGGFAIFWFVVKKQSFAELLNAIKCIFKK